MNEFEDYSKEKMTVDVVWANVFGLLLFIPIVLIFGLPYFLIWHEQFNMKSLIKSIPDSVGLAPFLFFVILVLGIVIHELIHGFVWSRYAKQGFKSIRFGVLWKMLTPYCHCKEPLKVKYYILGAIAPSVILGIIPSVIAIFIGNVGLLVFGMFFTVAAAGDFLIIRLIWKENSEDYVLDHPSEAGCYIYRKIDQPTNPIH
jgi:hypothetical protein